VGPRACLDRCERSRPQRESIPGPSITYIVAIPTELSRPTKKKKLKNVEYFIYLSSILKNGARCTCEIKSRITMVIT